MDSNKGWQMPGRNPDGSAKTPPGKVRERNINKHTATGFKPFKLTGDAETPAVGSSKPQAKPRKLLLDPPHESPTTASQAVGQAMQTRVEVSDPSNPLDPS